MTKLITELTPASSGSLVHLMTALVREEHVRYIIETCHTSFTRPQFVADYIVLPYKIQVYTYIYKKDI